jgi:hypothetical protein
MNIIVTHVPRRYRSNDGIEWYVRKFRLQASIEIEEPKAAQSTGAVLAKLAAAVITATAVLCIVELALL